MGEEVQGRHHRKRFGGEVDGLSVRRGSTIHFTHQDPLCFIPLLLLVYFHCRGVYSFMLHCQYVTMCTILIYAPVTVTVCTTGLCTLIYAPGAFRFQQLLSKYAYHTGRVVINMSLQVVFSINSLLTFLTKV